MATLPEGFSIVPQAPRATLPEGFSIVEPSQPDPDLPDVTAPVTGDQPPQRLQSRDILPIVGGLIGEAAAGANRAILGVGDIALSPVNVALELSGRDRLPSLTGLAAQKGDIAGPGLLTDIAAGGGELATAGLGIGSALRAGARLLPSVTAGESAALGTARQLAATTPAIDIAGGGGAGAGAVVGEEVGGTPGEIIGGLAGGLAGGVAVPIVKSAVQALSARLGRNIDLINPETGLPTPKFEKALAKRNLDFGSIIDDVDSLPAVISRSQPVDEVVDNIVKRKLREGAKDDALADVRLDQNRIIPDDLGKEAVRQGFRAGDVSAAKGASQPTKREMNRMLGMSRQISADASKAQDFRPTDIAGQHVMARFDFIRGRADSLRGELDDLAKRPAALEGTLPGPDTVRPLKGMEINTSKIEDNVFKQLDALDVNFTGSPPKLDFTGSLISKDKTSQRILKDVVDLLSEPGSDALRAHKLKRQLDSLIDFNKKSAEGLTEAGRNFAKSVRFSLNEAIRNESPEYSAINDKLSRSIGTMNEFQRVLGGTIDVFKPGASKAVGQDLRGLLSNRKSRVRLENSINEIDDTTKFLDGRFDVDVKDLVQFSNTLDDRFGAVARTSLKGELESVARGPAGIKDLAARKIGERLEDLRNVNDRKAFNVMQKILKRRESR